MKVCKKLAAGLVASLYIAGTASAADILCQDPTLNHMLVDSSYVSACLDAGTGNLTGNPLNDLFINGPGAGYSFIGEAGFSQTGDTGTFTLSPALWGAYDSIAIGFKFGTGNKPDEWFVYALNDGVSSGIWTFVNVFERGGGLSHVNLYGITGGNDVPEPGLLGLLGLGLAMLGLMRRRKF
ncbi:MAG: PEP-CTERM sorting domain-containing protein [Pseudomonadota bacterium]